MTTEKMDLELLEYLEDMGKVNAQTAQVLQFLIDWTTEDEGSTWEHLGPMSVEELKTYILEDDAEEPREWSAGFDWDAVEWTLVYGHLPFVCGMGEWRAAP